MESNFTSEAVIIAAGEGSRIIKNFLHISHKCLLIIEGRKLIEIIIDNFVKHGIKTVHLVTGFEGKLLQEQVIELNLNAKINFVHNKSWKAGNGTSVLAGAKKVKANCFILSMSDHWFSDGIVEKLNDANLTFPNILAIDEKLSAINDIEDATKVELGRENKILEIGKEIQFYDAIDCGVFRLTKSEIIDSLKEAQNEKGFSLSDGIKKLIDQKKMFYADVSGLLWQDVDTMDDYKATIRKYKKMLVDY